MRNNEGIIHLILLAIIIIIILSYLGISIKSVIEGKTFKDNFDYVWEKVKYAWDNYLGGPIKYLWDIFINILHKLKSNG
ncbi:MAG: hypothetical protein AAB491_01400 [Patescibacteria group bacterium]